MLRACFAGLAVLGLACNSTQQVAANQSNDRAPTPTAAPVAPSATSPAATAIEEDAAVAARPSAARGADAGATAPGTCARLYTADMYAKCRWTFGTYGYCGGMSPSPGDEGGRRGCVCNECLDHRDCTARAGGRCVQFPGMRCVPPGKGCVYPGEPCASPRACQAPKECFHDEVGHPTCDVPPPPRMRTQ